MLRVDAWSSRAERKANENPNSNSNQTNVDLLSLLAEWSPFRRFLSGQFEAVEKRIQSNRIESNPILKPNLKPSSGRAINHLNYRSYFRTRLDAIFERVRRVVLSLVSIIMIIIIMIIIISIVISWCRVCGLLTANCKLQTANSEQHTESRTKSLRAFERPVSMASKLANPFEGSFERIRQKMWQISNFEFRIVVCVTLELKSISRLWHQIESLHRFNSCPLRLD